MIRLNRATTAVLGRCLQALILVLVLERNLAAQPMVYTGLVVTDVRVGSTLMHNASLKMTFEGDAGDMGHFVTPPSAFCSGDSFYYISKGVARMEIGFQGRTRTARLNDGQVFVALDTCNGGIGFGAFLGPHGMEPAYPLTFTLGTAEYASITTGSSLLAGASSTTGSAWSCIGYPPQGVGNLDGNAPTYNCTPPDTYPLKSDIGDIVVYQPYYESDGSTGIASNHSGSTNRGAFLVRPKASGTTFATSGSSKNARASGVVYTLQTVADGSIGGHVFNQALVTLQMISETKSVTSQPSPMVPSKALYENRSGYATVTVDDGGEIIVADFEPGEVYVRYDTGTGVAGFGSRISPTYPVALNCSDSAYPSVNNYKVDCLQGEAWNYLNAGIGYNEYEVFQSGILSQLSYPVYPSAGVTALPQSLSQNTLLAGTAHTCAGVYTIYYNPITDSPYFPGDLGVCGSPAPRGLRTSKGKLFLQDLEGGSLSPGNTPILGQEDGSAGGWAQANSGSLHVEVYKGDN